MPAETSSAADREILTTRVLDAPRELIFDAWTDPKHVAHWWGPNGFTNTIHEMSVKPGGVWRFIMHGPDGTDYPNKIVFIEVVEPERLVYDHGWDGEGDEADFHVTVTFAPRRSSVSGSISRRCRSSPEEDALITAQPDAMIILWV